ncbi:unnamed protein product [Closterium sp. Yama58-4]|nr:unnamed protein product [Closterium sp. Yama58-4]
MLKNEVSGSGILDWSLFGCFEKQQQEEEEEEEEEQWGELPDVASYMSLRQQYELNAATMLKNEGNKLHGMGKYSEAAEKYNRARDNLAMHSSPAAVSLRRTCAVNLMSCHLKTNAFAHAVSVGTQVISEDGSNLKALYRRGLAYKELGQLKVSAGFRFMG